MNPKFFRNGIVMLVLVVGTAALLFTWIQSTTPNNAVGYSQFLADVRDNKVDSVVQQGDTLTVRIKASSQPYTVTVPSVLTQVLNDMIAAAETGRLGPPTTTGLPWPLAAQTRSAPSPPIAATCRPSAAKNARPWLPSPPFFSTAIARPVSVSQIRTVWSVAAVTTRA